MGQGAVIRAEKKLLRYLECGGAVTDDAGQQLLLQFVFRAGREEQIADLMRSLEFTANDLAVIYAAMVEALMPNPCIRVGGLMLVPTLFFAEPQRLESLLIEIRRDTRGLVPDERLKAMTAIASAAAVGTRAANDQRWGRAEFTIVSMDPGRRAALARGPGCAAVILTVLAAVVSAACGWPAILVAP